MALTLDITMSLDGFIAAPNASLENPLGEGGMRLHEWAFAAESWRKQHGQSGGEANQDSEVIDEATKATGAVIMGRKMFSGGEGPWEDDRNADAGGETTRRSTFRSSSLRTTRASRNRWKAARRSRL